MTEQHEGREKLVQAYGRMMERVRHGLAETGETFERALAQARERAVELGELTREEAERVTAYVRRDLQDMAEYLEEQGQKLDSWFHIDLELIEARILELMMSVADRTKLAWAQLAARAERAADYHTGEITGPGVLQCRRCGKRLQFRTAGHIPPCPGCRGTDFIRLRGADTT